MYYVEQIVDAYQTKPNIRNAVYRVCMLVMWKSEKKFFYSKCAQQDVIRKQKYINKKKPLFCALYLLKEKKMFFPLVFACEYLFSSVNDYLGVNFSKNTFLTWKM